MSEIARPLEEWHEDIGPCLWWVFPLSEPPYVGSPLDCGQTVEVVTRYYEQGKVVEKLVRYFVGGWPGYHTHWTPLPPAPRGQIEEAQRADEVAAVESISQPDTSDDIDLEETTGKAMMP